LILREPPSAKNAATLAAFWLHQAAVYLVPNSFSWAASIGIPLALQPASVTSDNAVTMITRMAALPLSVTHVQPLLHSVATILGRGCADAHAAAPSLHPYPLGTP
jgi:hypothetical protein